MPAKYRKNKVKPRGVSNRNRGLQWIRANATEGNGFNVKILSPPTNCDKFIYLFLLLFLLSKGVLYFADDDNTYDLDIFDEVSEQTCSTHTRHCLKFQSAFFIFFLLVVFSCVLQKYIYISRYLDIYNDKILYGCCL